MYIWQYILLQKPSNGKEGAKRCDALTVKRQFFCPFVTGVAPQAGSIPSAKHNIIFHF